MSSELPQIREQGGYSPGGFVRRCRVKHLDICLPIFSLFILFSLFTTSLLAEEEDYRVLEQRAILLAADDLFQSLFDAGEKITEDNFGDTFHRIRQLRPIHSGVSVQRMHLLTDIVSSTIKEPKQHWASEKAAQQLFEHAKTMKTNDENNTLLLWLENFDFTKPNKTEILKSFDTFLPLVKSLGEFKIRHDSNLDSIVNILTRVIKTWDNFPDDKLAHAAASVLKHRAKELSYSQGEKVLSELQKLGVPHTEKNVGSVNYKQDLLKVATLLSKNHPRLQDSATTYILSAMKSENGSIRNWAALELKEVASHARNEPVWSEDSIAKIIDYALEESKSERVTALHISAAPALSNATLHLLEALESIIDPAHVKKETVDKLVESVFNLTRLRNAAISGRAKETLMKLAKRPKTKGIKNLVGEKILELAESASQSWKDLPVEAYPSRPFLDFNRALLEAVALTQLEDDPYGGRYRKLVLYEKASRSNLNEVAMLGKGLIDGKGTEFHNYSIMQQYRTGHRLAKENIRWATRRVYGMVATCLRPGNPP